MSDLKSQIREALRARSQPCTCAAAAIDGFVLVRDRGCLGVCEDTVDRVAAVIEPMRKALEPFAKMADQVDRWQQGIDPVFPSAFDADDLRRAREIYTALSPKESP